MRLLVAMLAVVVFAAPAFAANDCGPPFYQCFTNPSAQPQGEDPKVGPDFQYDPAPYAVPDGFVPGDDPGPWGR